MGNSQSQVANIVNSSCMSVTNDFVSTNIATTQASSVNKLTFTLNIGVADGCPVKVGQKIESTVSALSTLSKNASRTLASSLQSQLSAALTQSTEMVNGLAAATGGNTQDTTMSITNTIEQSITNRINDTNINQVAVDSYNSIDGVLNIAVCRNSPIEVNQGIVSNIIAQNILTQITADILNNSAIATASATGSQTTSMKNQGLNDLVDSIGKAVSSIVGAFTGPLAAVWIACALVLCLCCAGLVYFLMSPAGQNATKTAANAGAKYAAKH